MLRKIPFQGQRGHGVHHIGPYLSLCGFVQHAEEEGDSRKKPHRLAVDLSTGELRRRTRTVEAAQTNTGKRDPGMRTGKSPNDPAATQQRRVAQRSGACPPSGGSCEQLFLRDQQSRMQTAFANSQTFSALSGFTLQLRVRSTL